MDLRNKTMLQGSAMDDAPDSQAITVRTPNAPPLEKPVVIARDGRILEEQPIPLVRRPATNAIVREMSPTSTLPMSGRPVPSRLPLSLSSPVSRANEKQWFAQEPLVAPGVPEMPEPLSATLAPPPSRRGSRGAGFAMVAVLLVGIAAAGSVFFLTSSHGKEAKAPEPASTTQVTNADLKPATPPEPTPTPVAAPPAGKVPLPPVRTVRVNDLPSTSAPAEPTAPATQSTSTSGSSDLQDNR